MLMQCALIVASFMVQTPDADFLDVLDSYTFSGTPLRWAPQLTVAEVGSFKTPSGTVVSDVWLGAVSLGDNDIALFEIDFSGTPEITGVETITFPDNNDRYAYLTFDPTFMELPISGTDEWCLVVPVVEREDNPSGSDPAEDGNIMIVRLESRDANHELVTIDNGFTLSAGLSSYTPEEVYYCMENPDNGDYLISFGGDGDNVVCVASFNQIRNQFVGDNAYEIDDFYFAHNNHTVPCRPYEHFYFDEANDAAYLTNHNGGVAIWDYSSMSTGLPVISRMAVQQGGWSSSISSNIEELGDVHRATVLECNQGPDSNSKLLFFGNLTMGILIYDVTDPANPNFVFQWDHDTKPYDWTSWHGAGAGTEPDESDYPAVTFGLDVRGYNDSNDYIHLYACNGSDGLTTIDLSEFLCPWATSGRTEFAALDEESYGFTYSSQDFWAHDLRTFQEGSTIYVLTTWREPPDSGNQYSTSETGTVALVLYEDDTISPPVDSGRESGRNTTILSEPVVVSVTGSPNPTTESQILHISSSTSTTCCVEVFDISGRIVRRADVEINAGMNSIGWMELPGNPLSSGNYLIKVTTASGEELISKSIILN